MLKVCMVGLSGFVSGRNLFRCQNSATRNPSRWGLSNSVKTAAAVCTYGTLTLYYRRLYSGPGSVAINLRAEVWSFVILLCAASESNAVAGDDQIFREIPAAGSARLRLKSWYSREATFKETGWKRHGACPRPCTQHPSRPRPAFRRCDSAKWSGRSPERY